MGFMTRLRLDPILTPQGWEDMYDEFFNRCREMKLRPQRITLGTYREKMPQLDVWRDKWGLPEVEFERAAMQRAGTHWHVSDDSRVNTYKTVNTLCQKYLPESEVGLCKETYAVRKKAGLSRPCCNCLK